MFKALVLTIFCVCSAVAPCVVQESQDRQQILNGIDSGTGLLQAGNSGDKTLIPIIEKRIRLGRHESKVVREGGMALAKLGVTRNQQMLHCDLHSLDKFRINEAALALEYVGGWFAVRELIDLLDSQERYEKAKPKDTGDLVLVTPRVIALQSLSRLFPDGPARFTNPMDYSPARISEEAKLWKEWFEKNEATLNQLEPLGTGIRFNAASCAKNRHSSSHAK